MCDFAFWNCDNLTKIEIPENSNLQTIESNAFSYSKIKEIYFPTNLKELKEGWCDEIDELTKIIISPSNDRFIFKENKYLLGKTNNDRNEFDILLFVNRNINKISIPSNIKIISTSAFQNCENLTKIEIPTNSKLETIGENAFSNSKITQIYIPLKISKKIGYSFYDCKNLIKVEIPTDDNKSCPLIKKELLAVPSFDVPVDCSFILSFSIYSTEISIITKDYKAIIGNKYYDEECYNFKENTIIDERKVYYPISGFKCFNYNLYMVSEVEKGIKTKLFKDYNILNIGKFNPVAIFCGSSNCAAIDLNGLILYIPGSYKDESSKLIEPKCLPKREKAVEIACLTDYLYVLSLNGNLYMSKNANTFNIKFEKVEQFKNVNVIQISGTHNHILVLTEEGKVYSKGKNLYGELGTGDKKNHLIKFIEITSLNKYKITSISAGENHSLFLTSKGKILACGSNISNQCFNDTISSDDSILLPIETRVRSGAQFCISSFDSAAACIGFDPEMSPNRRVKNEINVLLLGCQKKIEILHAFANNNFENSFNNDGNKEEEDSDEEKNYIVNLEVCGKEIKLRLIDVKDIDDSKVYHRAVNLIYFYDNSNQTSSFDELNLIYEKANQVWNNEIKLIFVNCISANSKKIKNDEISKKYKCEIYEIGDDKNIDNINKPFYSFLPDIYKDKKEVFKIGKEYRNPFNNINKDHINIGLFGSKKVNKTDLAFRYIYGDLYKNIYEDFITNFKEINLDKIVEIENKYFEVSILDSTFVDSKDDDFSSYYSLVQGIVFVFQIDSLSSSSISDFIQMLKIQSKVN